MSIDDRDDDPLAARGSTYPSGALSIHQIGGDRVMDYETLDSLRQNHPAWKLLRAGHAALIVSFLHRTYIKPNVRTLRESELASRLEDTLFHLR